MVQEKSGRLNYSCGAEKRTVALCIYVCSKYVVGGGYLVEVEGNL